MLILHKPLIRALCPEFYWQMLHKTGIGGLVIFNGNASMKASFKALLALATAIMLGTGLASASLAVPSNTPLMVIRYNQPKVFYQRQLYNAVSRAVAIKPSVVFDVVSFTPAAADKAKSSQQTSALVGDMVSVGIPQERIHVSEQPVDDSRTHEIYIYVD